MNGPGLKHIIVPGENVLGARVPHRDDWRIGPVVFVIEKTERCCAEQKMLRFADRQSDPAHREDAAKVTMRKESDVFFHPADLRDEAVSTGEYLFWCFTARAIISEKIPIRAFLANGCGMLPYPERRVWP